MFESLIVRVQQEVLEAVGNVMIGQELEIILIILELQGILFQNLQRQENVNTGSEVSVNVTTGPHLLSRGLVSVHCRNDILETGRKMSCLFEGKGWRYLPQQTQFRLEQQHSSSIVLCPMANDMVSLNIRGHLGLLAKTTAVWEMMHFYFRLLSESTHPPPPTLLIALRNQASMPDCLCCQACSFKRQMLKLCVDVSVWEWVCKTPGKLH